MNYEILQNAVVFRNVFDDLVWFIDNQKEKTLADSGIIRSNNAGYDKDFRYSTQANVSSENPVVERVRQLKKIILCSMMSTVNLTHTLTLSGEQMSII